jgi:hypothetical protein
MALLGAQFDGIAVDERTLVTRLLDRFAPGMLVPAGRSFPSFELWRDAVATGADLAWRVSASFTLPMVERLSDGTHLSRLHGREKVEQITVRAVQYCVKDADTGVSEVFALATTLLDPQAHPALGLAELYAARWEVQLLFKILKVEIRTPTRCCARRARRWSARSCGACCAVTRRCAWQPRTSRPAPGSTPGG